MKWLLYTILAFSVSQARAEFYKEYWCDKPTQSYPAVSEMSPCLDYVKGRSQVYATHEAGVPHNTCFAYPIPGSLTTSEAEQAKSDLRSIYGVQADTNRIQSFDYYVNTAISADVTKPSANKVPVYGYVLKVRVAYMKSPVDHTYFCSLVKEKGAKNPSLPEIIFAKPLKQ